MNVPENKEFVKRNLVYFKQERKEKVYNAKKSSRTNGMIQKKFNDGSTMEELTSIINIAQALDDNSDNEYDSSNSTTSDEM